MHRNKQKSTISSKVPVPVDSESAEIENYDNNLSENDSFNHSDNADQSSYETGDSELLDADHMDIDSQNDSNLEEELNLVESFRRDFDDASSSLSNSDELETHNEPEDVQMNSQKLFNTALLDEINSVKFFEENKHSSRYSESQQEINFINASISEVKSEIASLSSIEVVWKSQKEQSKSSQTTSIPASPMSSHIDSTRFFAENFFERYYSNDVSRDLTLQTLKNELTNKDNLNDPLFVWKAPEDTKIIGPYRHKTSILCHRREKSVSRRSVTEILTSIDLAIQLPASMFKHSDIKGHRYQSKRLLYMTILATKLHDSYLFGKRNDDVKAVPSSRPNSALFSNIQWSCDSEDSISFPFLSFQLSLKSLGKFGKKSSGPYAQSFTSYNNLKIQINLHPCISPTTFKISQLLPWKPQALYTSSFPNETISSVYQIIKSSIDQSLDRSASESTDDISSSSIAYEAPEVYKTSIRRFAAKMNQLILKDALLIHHDSQIDDTFSQYPNLRNGIIMAYRWAQARHMQNVLTLHFLAMWFTHLVNTSAFNKSMEAIDFFKAWLKFLSKDKLEKLNQQRESQREQLYAYSSHSQKPVVSSLPTYCMSNPPSISKSSSSQLFKNAFESYSQEFLLQEFKQIFPAVLLDRSGYYNVFWNIQEGFWHEIVFEAVQSWTILERPDSSSFSCVFKTGINLGGCEINLNSDINSNQPSSLVPIESRTDIVLDLKLDLNRCLPKLLANGKNSKRISQQKSWLVVGDLDENVNILIPKSANKNFSKSNKMDIDNVESSLDIDHEKTKETRQTFKQMNNSKVGFTLLDLIAWLKICLNSLLNESLKQRIEYYRIYDSTNDINLLHNSSQLKWDVFIEDRKSENFCGLPMTSILKYYIGIQVHQLSWQKLLETGPSAQEESQVREFINLWGKEKTGLRKFKDGLILQCVAWGDLTPLNTMLASIHRADQSNGNNKKSFTFEDSDNLALSCNKHRIIKEIVSWMVERHIISSLSHGDYFQGIEDGSTSLEEIFQVNFVADPSMYSLLKSHPLVHPHIIGISTQKQIMPHNQQDSQYLILSAFSQLKKHLKSLKGLPLTIKSLTLHGPISRGSHPSPPAYNPLCDPEISLKHRKTLLSTSPSSLLCPMLIPVVLVFDGSGSWPDDLEAIRAVKTAFYVKLFEVIGEQLTQCESSVSSDSLTIFFRGFGFKIEIYYPKELILRTVMHRQLVIQHRKQEALKTAQEKSRKEQELRFNHRPSFVKNEFSAASSNLPLKVKAVDEYVLPLMDVYIQHSRLGTGPKVGQLLTSLSIASPSYGPTCAIFKQWLSSHLIPLAGFADGLLVDLIVARVFQTSPHLLSPWTSPPNHHYSAFFRVLYFLSKLDWTHGPVMVPLEEFDMESGSTQGPLGWTKEKFEAVQKLWSLIPKESTPVLTVCFSDGWSALNSNSSAKLIGDPDFKPVSADDDDPTDDLITATSSMISVNDNNQRSVEILTSKNQRRKVRNLAEALKPFRISCLSFGTQRDLSFSDSNKLEQILDYDTDGKSNVNQISSDESAWQVEPFVATSILKRVKNLALQSLKQLPSFENLNKSSTEGEDADDENMEEEINPKSDRESISEMFESSLLDFDLCLELKKSAITRNSQINYSESGKYKKHTMRNSNFLAPPPEIPQRILSHLHESIKSTKSQLDHEEKAQGSKRIQVIPVLAGFDPVSYFIDSLQRRFGDKMLIFYEKDLSNLVGIIFKPSCFSATSHFNKSNNGIDSIAISLDGSHNKTKVVPNIVQIMNEIWIMGNGLISNMHLVGGQQRLSRSTESS